MIKELYLSLRIWLGGQNLFRISLSKRGNSTPKIKIVLISVFAFLRFQLTFASPFPVAVTEIFFIGKSLKILVGSQEGVMSSDIFGMTAYGCYSTSSGVKKFRIQNNSKLNRDMI